MRYALRNKHKIKHVFNQSILDTIVKSLDEEFKKNTIETTISDPYDLLTIKYFGNDEGSIVFHVLKITYDVYKLAFKEFIK